jgi:Zn-dependent protease with chaperone function
MRPPLLIFGYALAVAWCVPALLARLTARGIGARLGITAWLAAMISALACAAVAVELLVRAAVRGWPGLAEAVCRTVAGSACSPQVYRGALFEAGLAVAALVAVLTAAMLTWRYGRGVQRAQRRTRAHADTARMTGREIPARPAGVRPAEVAPADARDAVILDAVVLEAPRPVAYCLPGRPATIVISSAALAVLDSAQLTAVLAHERAHLAGRHHLLTGLTRGLAATFPGVPLFARGAAEVARLAEMRADDAAARRSGRRTLVAALLSMGTGAAVPTAALGATGFATTARVRRLLDPPRRSCRARYGAALAGVTLLLALASTLVTTFSTVIVSRGGTLG